MILVYDGEKIKELLFCIFVTGPLLVKSLLLIPLGTHEPLFIICEQIQALFGAM